jgi:hypothetical protein
MTILEVRNREGKLVGRCDAHCYGAKNEECDCVCGGKNHKKGEEKAKEMATRLLEEPDKREGDLFWIMPDSARQCSFSFAIHEKTQYDKE